VERATARSIGLFGVGLALALFAAIVLALGMSWSHVRRRLTGQADVDEADSLRHGGSAGITADEGTALQSGDVIEVRVPYDDQATRPIGRAQTPE
jgi:hypothetical protein